MNVSWDTAADCCVCYMVNVSHGTKGMADKLSFPVQVKQEDVNVSVQCLDPAGAK